MAEIYQIKELQQAKAELQRMNRALRSLSRCNQALVRATSEDELLKEICRLLIDDSGYRLAWVCFKKFDEQKSVRVVASAGCDDGYIDDLHITWAETERGCGPTGVALRNGEPVICRDIRKQLDGKVSV